MKNAGLNKNVDIHNTPIKPKVMDRNCTKIVCDCSKELAELSATSTCYFCAIPILRYANKMLHDSPFRIRKFEESDCKHKMFCTGAAAFDLMPTGQAFDFQELTKKERAGFIVYVCVKKENNVPVGFVSFDPEIMHLSRVGTSYEYQKLYIASALVNILLFYAQKEGKNITAKVRAEKVKFFQQQFGFVITSDPWHDPHWGLAYMMTLRFQQQPT